MQLNDKTSILLYLNGFNVLYEHETFTLKIIEFSPFCSYQMTKRQIFYFQDVIHLLTMSDK